MKYFFLKGLFIISILANFLFVLIAATRFKNKNRNKTKKSETFARHTKAKMQQYGSMWNPFSNNLYDSQTEGVEFQPLDYLEEHASTLTSKELSENQKSKTFKPVGPMEDSTKDYKGNKYSKLYKITSMRKVNPGFYGRSRVTRL